MLINSPIFKYIALICLSVYIYIEYNFRQQIKNNIKKILKNKINILNKENDYDFSKLTKYYKNSSYDELLSIITPFIKKKENIIYLTPTIYKNIMKINYFGTIHVKNNKMLDEFHKEVKKQTNILINKKIITNFNDKNNSNTNMDIISHLNLDMNNISFVNEPYFVYLICNKIYDLFYGSLLKNNNIISTDLNNTIFYYKENISFENTTLVLPSISNEIVTCLHLGKYVNNNQQIIIPLLKNIHDKYQSVYNYIKNIIKFIKQHNIKKLDIIGWSYGGYIIIRMLNYIQKKNINIKFNQIDMIEPGIFMHGGCLINIVPYNSILNNYNIILDSIKNTNDNFIDNIKNKIIAFLTTLVFKHYQLIYKNLLISAYRGVFYDMYDLNKLLKNANKLNILLSDHDFLTNKNQLYKFIDKSNKKISIINMYGYHGDGIHNYHKFKQFFQTFY
jgi:hypothetical protein